MALTRTPVPDSSCEATWTRLMTPALLGGIGAPGAGAADARDRGGGDDRAPARRPA